MVSGSLGMADSLLGVACSSQAIFTAMDLYIDYATGEELAAYELMDASDYLTEKVQRFTLDGNMEYLNDYFTEAFITNRRENAIAQMSKNPESATALAHLKEAMEASKNWEK